MENIFDKFMPFITSFLSFITGFFIAIFSEPIRQYIFKPLPKIYFENTPDCISFTQEKTQIQLGPIIVNDSYYIRAKVINNKKRLAKDCEAYLINIEKKEGGLFKRTLYCDSILLSWSCQTPDRAYEKKDIGYGIIQHLDILSTREGNKNFRPEILVRPNRYENIFKEEGVFRFTIQVAGSNFEPIILRIIFEWSGKWNDFKVYKFEE